MKFDMVHDVQNAYRKVLNSMSRPGVIENLKEECLKINMDFKFYKSTFVLMSILLDKEVSFKIFSKKEESINNFVRQITNSNVTLIDMADYIFVLNDGNSIDSQEIINDSKIGSLIDPHKSATIIFEVENLSNEKDIELVGPGIKNLTYAKVETDINWVNEREKKNVEYPLGIDIIFVDKHFNVMCLPRTTQVRKGVN